MTRPITRDLLEALLHCRLKGHMVQTNEPGEQSDYQALSAGLRADVPRQAIDRIAARQPAAAVVREVPLTAAVLKAGPTFVLDALLEDDSFSLRFDGLKRVDGPSKLGDYHYVPMLFHGAAAVRAEQRLLLEAYGLLLSRLQGRAPGSGITKAGCPQTRAMLVQAVQAADHPGPIGPFFGRMRRKKQYNVAVIATARKLVTVAYLMLKHDEPYRYAKPDVVKGKLANCRRKAGKSPGRAKAAGSDESRLNDLYREHGMPTCQPPAGWSAGERRALGNSEVAAFAEGVHKRPPARLRAKVARKSPDQAT